MRTGRRNVRALAHRRIARPRITYGECRARCDCRTTFRTSPAGVRPRVGYDGGVRPAVLGRIPGDGPNVEATLRSPSRDFVLGPPTGFVYDGPRDAVAAPDTGEYRRRVPREFSGAPCADELHLGRDTPLPAAGPLRDVPAAFALVGANDGGHVRRFLGRLRGHGLPPRVVATDGPPPYPALPAELWPHAERRSRVFPVLRDLSRAIPDAVGRSRRAVGRRGRGGRKRRRGRPSETRRRPERRTRTETATSAFEHRRPVVERRDRSDERDPKDLSQLFRDVPESGPPRDFADAVVRPFAADRTGHRAWRRRRALRANAAYPAIPESEPASEAPDRAKFGEGVAFPRTPAARRVRPNNHVERCDREVRFREEVRYEWRRRRTPVRFPVPASARRRDRVPAAPRAPVPDTADGGEVMPETRPQPMRKSRTRSRREAA